MMAAIIGLAQGQCFDVDRAANSDRGQAFQGGITGDKCHGSKLDNDFHNHVPFFLSPLA